jgi:hypothetical protein
MIQLIIAAALALLIIAAVAAPLEALGWWAGWFGKDRDLEAAKEQVRAATDAPATSYAEHFVVYLTGIGSATGAEPTPYEIPLFEYLEAHLPRTVLIHDIFPYSVVNEGLTGERIFSRFWKFQNRMRVEKNKPLLGFFIHIRNLFQVAVSADSRYGPVYNLGVAKEILLSLLRHGYRPGSGVPVTLIGSSGGGQVSLGAVPYLTVALHAPVRIVSLGGVLSGDPGGAKYVTKIEHLVGAKDPVAKLVPYAFPERWPLIKWSEWNKAVAQGKYAEEIIGPMTHSGPKCYFDTDSFLPNGQSYLERAGEAVIAAIARMGLPALIVSKAEPGSGVQFAQTEKS